MATTISAIGTHFTGPIKLSKTSMPISTDLNGISEATTLTADESNGMHYILGATGFAITFPAATQGWRCKFTIGADFTTDFVLTAPSAILEGCILEAGVVQDVAGGTTITLEDGADNIGDFFSFWSDGTSIFASGSTLNGNSVTVA